MKLIANSYTELAMSCLHLCDHQFFGFFHDDLFLLFEARPAYEKGKANGYDTGKDALAEHGILCAEVLRHRPHQQAAEGYHAEVG